MTMPRKNATPDTAPALDVNTSYEDALRELEQIVTQLERGDLPLERTLELHARGQLLAAHCSTLLENAELSMRKLNTATGEETDS
jgi:exodeoxyribonuclease VII small subunit